MEKVVSMPQIDQKYFNLISLLNYKFEQKYRMECMEKWQKDGMWKSIKTGKILENTEKARSLKRGK